MKMGSLAILVCLYRACQQEMIVEPGDLPARCPVCKNLGKWRHLVPSEVTQRVEAYIARLEADTQA